MPMLQGLKNPTIFTLNWIGILSLGLHVGLCSEFFGKFYVLNNTKFYIDKVANTITFQAWEDIGMGVINIASVRKLELYAADANPTTDADGLLANFIPLAEDQLGAVNNRVDQGLVFPQVVQF